NHFVFVIIGEVERNNLGAVIDRTEGRDQTFFHLRNEFAVSDQDADEQFYRSELTDSTHRNHETTITKGNPGQIRRRNLRVVCHSSKAPARSPRRSAPAIQGLVEAL